MSNPAILDNHTWRFLYSQITSGEIGKQCLFDSSGGIVANPTYGAGLFDGSGNQGSDNFYNLTVSVQTTRFTNELLVLANYYAQQLNGVEKLLGVMGNTPVIGNTGDGQINYSGFTEQATKFHTLLFNTNTPYPTSSSIIITINYYYGVNLVNPLTQVISVSGAGNNYLFTLTKSTIALEWDNIALNVARGGNVTTNIVGILKTTQQITPENLVCFAENSMVFTPNGEVAIQNLKQGDIVYDENYNLQTVEFVAKRTFFPSKSANKYSIPYEIKQGQLSENVPTKDTIVSASHLIKHEGKMVPASELGTEAEVNTVITYYNVSVSNYSTMIVNGMVSETLNTSNDKKVYEKTF